ncbi:Iron-sulfur assembly protein 1, partial [Massospora cicadina]
RLLQFMLSSIVSKSFSATVKKQAPTLKLRKAALSLVRRLPVSFFYLYLHKTPAAVNRLKELYSEGGPKFLKIGVRTKGCSGLSYALDYVTEKARFDEEVSQDGKPSL